VTLAYGRHTAISDASFTLPSGAVSALIGPNGSGKSTLLHAMAGLLSPTSGSIEVLERPADEARGRVAYVLQATTVNEHMPVTVREIVTMGRYGAVGAFGRIGADGRAAVDGALQRLDITSLANRHLGELSGGQRQRVFVAQGLAQEADVLLLDEPVTGLDLVSQQRILEVIEDERARGHTVVLTTHDLGEAAVADHLLLLAGRVVASGPARDVLTTEHLSDAYGGRVIRVEDGAVFLDDTPHHHLSHD
jgi:manganese transport system ATP-binding protein